MMSLLLGLHGTLWAVPDKLRMTLNGLCLLPLGQHTKWAGYCTHEYQGRQALSDLQLWILKVSIACQKSPSYWL